MNGRLRVLHHCGGKGRLANPLLPKVWRVLPRFTALPRLSLARRQLLDRADQRWLVWDALKPARPLIFSACLAGHAG